MIKITDEDIEIEGNIIDIIYDISNLFFHIATAKEFLVVKEFCEQDFFIDFDKILNKIKEIKNDGDNDDKTRDWQEDLNGNI